MRSFVTLSLRNSALILLAILVSGVLPALVQGYAWIDMARKAGGFSSLSTVLVDAPPCPFCNAARELQDSAPSDDNAPLPMSKIDLLKSATSFEAANDFLFASETKLELTFPLPADSHAPRNLAFGPGTPPPRATV